MAPKKSILDFCLSSDDESQFVQLPSSSQKQPVPDDIAEEENQRRVFNEEDELIILKAIPEFMSKTGNNPYSTGFHAFVKNLIRGKITVEQLKRKIRWFKGKYGKEGKTFTKTHEKKAFKLFMKIDWGTNEESKSGSKSAKKGLELVGDSKRAELMHQIAQLKLYIDRAKFIKDQAILMVHELEKSAD